MSDNKAHYLAPIIINMCLVLALLISSIKSSVASQPNIHPLCQQHNNALWKIILKNKKATFLRHNEENSDLTIPAIGRSYRYSIVNINNDGIDDLYIDLEGCGSGGCMSTWAVGCKNNLYYPVILPEYYEHLTIDKDHSFEVYGLAWQDFTQAVYREAPNDSGFKAVTPGWRLQFNGTHYKKSFLPKEYQLLIEKNQLGQLAHVAYPLLKQQPNHPNIAAIKDTLLSPLFFKKVVQTGAINLDSFPEEMKNNKQLILALLKSNPTTTVKTLDKNLLNDIEIAKTSVKNSGQNLQYFSENIRANQNVVEIAIQQNRFALKHAGIGIRSNKALMLKWSKAYKISSAAIAEELKNDAAVTKTFITNDSESYVFFNEAIKKDKALASLAFKDNGLLILHAPESIQKDRDLFILAVTEDSRVLERLPNNFVKDRVFNLLLMCKNQNVYGKLPSNMTADKKIARIALYKFSGNFRYVPKALQNNRKFILDITSVNPGLYRNLSPALQADQAIAETVFSQASGHWNYAPSNIKNNPKMQTLEKDSPRFNEKAYLQQSREAIDRECKAYI